LPPTTTLFPYTTLFRSCELAAGELVDAAAADHDLPGGRLIQTADQIEERGLARARRTHQRDEVALRDVQSEAVQNFDLLLAALVHLGDAADLDHGLGHGNLGSTEDGYSLTAWRRSQPHRPGVPPARR